MNNNFKSATTAGLLGIFLGAVGAHDWYLGDRKKGTTHVCLFGAGLVLTIIVNVALPSILSFWTLLKVLWLLNILNWCAWGLIGASEIWGFIDGIKILTAGDAGLAQRGFMVSPNTISPNMNINNQSSPNNFNNQNPNSFNSQNNMNQPNNSNNNQNSNQPQNINGINNPNSSAGN